MKWIGIDLHSNNFKACFLSEDGKTWFEEYDLSCDGLEQFRENLEPGDQIAVETTGNSSWFCDQVIGSVDRIVPVNTRKFEVIRRSGKKTDRNDAKTLAYFLSKDMLPAARVKSQWADDLYVLAQSREVFVSKRKVLINMIRSQYSSHGIKLRKESLKHRVNLESLDFSVLTEAKKFQVKLLGAEILHCNEVIAELEVQIAKIASGVKGYEGLLSIGGIGSLSAAIFLSVIGDIEDFSTPDKLAAYFGIVPWVNQSNETVTHGRITRRGNKLARKTLVQCTLSSLKCSPYMRNHYDRIKKRRGSGKAIIATSRKFLKVIYLTLKNGWVFENFSEYKRKKTDRKDE